ncbi:MAG: hypothetical protein QM715_04855 [Nibricoccus sp.]
MGHCAPKPTTRTKNARFPILRIFYDALLLVYLFHSCSEGSAGFGVRLGDLRFIVTKYRYALDPVCLVACVLYAANRWCLPATFKGPFLRNHFNDSLLIPAALPLVLWVQRKLRLRRSDAKPNGKEVLLHLVIWSVAAEIIGPLLFSHATGDLWDVVAYTSGALVAWLIWNIR